MAVGIAEVWDLKVMNLGSRNINVFIGIYLLDFCVFAKYVKLKLRPMSKEKVSVRRHTMYSILLILKGIPFSLLNYIR